MRAFQILPIAAIVLFFLPLEWSFAQPTPSFNYQAALRNADGQALANQSVLLKISLTDESATNLYFVESHQTTTNPQGIVTLQIGNGTLISGDFMQIPWGSEQIFLKVEKESAGGNFMDMGTSRIASVPYALFSGNAEGGVTGTGTAGKIALWTDASNLISLESFTVEPNVEVVSNPQAGDDDPIFEVKNRDGNVVFGVYQTGVRVYVDESNSKAEKGGFAVGGLSTGKEDGNLFFRVTPDSVRVLLRQTEGRAEKGGFAVGGLSTGKSVQDLFFIAPDSARIYINTDTTRAEKGGFAVGGLSTGKSSGEEYLRITRDSARINISNENSRAEKGGFAVGGLSTGKDENSFLFLTPNNYFIGHQSGANNTTGLYNTFIGYNSGYSNTEGESNIFLGYQSGYNHRINGNNVFIGNRAGYTDSSGNYNLYLGYEAGRDNLNGQFNVMLGNSAGSSLSSGFDNVLIGNLAGGSSTSGDRNIFIGNGAGVQSNSTDNIFLGNYSGQFQKGNSNVLIGQYAGFADTLSQANIYIGRHAGREAMNSSYNLFIGLESGMHHRNGTNNIFIGNYSGYQDSAGNQNIFIGERSGQSNRTGSNNLFLGNYAASNHKYGDGNTFVGMSSGVNHVQGQNNVFLGYGSGDANVAGQGNVFLGYMAGAGETGSGRLYIHNSSADSVTTLIYGVFEENFLRINNKLGVGRVPETNALELEGDASKTTAGSWLSNADKSIKTDIQDIVNARDAVMKLRPVKFRYSTLWRQKHPGVSDRYFYSYIAQEYREVFPESVVEGNDNTGRESSTTLLIDTHDAHIFTTKAVQELILENRELKEHIQNQQQHFLRQQEKLEHLIREIELIKAFLTKEP
jgi:hypothetical protein